LPASVVSESVLAVLSDGGADDRNCHDRNVVAGVPAVPTGGEEVRCKGIDRVSDELFSVFMNGFGAAALDAFPNAGPFFFRFGLLVDVGDPLGVYSFEDGGGQFPAQVAVQTLIGDVNLAGPVLWKAVLKGIVGHAGRCQ
jgi:hypothetical protein